MHKRWFNTSTLTREVVEDAFQPEALPSLSGFHALFVCHPPVCNAALAKAVRHCNLIEGHVAIPGGAESLHACLTDSRGSAALVNICKVCLSGKPACDQISNLTRQGSPRGLSQWLVWLWLCTQMCCLHIPGAHASLSLWLDSHNPHRTPAFCTSASIRLRRPALVWHYWKQAAVFREGSHKAALA